MGDVCGKGASKQEAAMAVESVSGEGCSWRRKRFRGSRRLRGGMTLMARMVEGNEGRSYGKTSACGYMGGICGDVAFLWGGGSSSPSGMLRGFIMGSVGSVC